MVGRWLAGCWAAKRLRPANDLPTTCPQPADDLQERPADNVPTTCKNDLPSTCGQRADAPHSRFTIHIPPKLVGGGSVGPIRPIRPAHSLPTACRQHADARLISPRSPRHRVNLRLSLGPGCPRGSDSGGRIRPMEREFDVELYEGEDGRWVVECPALPGCVSQGRTEAEALEMIKDAILACLPVQGSKATSRTSQTT